MRFEHSAPGGEKRVSVELGGAAVEAVVSALLVEWGYVLAPPATAALRLVGKDGGEAPGRGTVFWSSPGGSGRLSFPLDLEELWIALGISFYSPLRRNIRLPLFCPVEVCARGRRGDGHLTSLSAMGGRFGYDQELATEEEVSLVLRVGEEKLALEGRVIYAIDRRELGSAGVEMGAVFDRTREPVRQRIKELIVAAYLERIRHRLDPDLFGQGLAGFRLPPGGPAEVFLP